MGLDHNGNIKMNSICILWNHSLQCARVGGQQPITSIAVKLEALGYQFPPVPCLQDQKMTHSMDHRQEEVTCPCIEVTVWPIDSKISHAQFSLFFGQTKVVALSFYTIIVHTPARWVAPVKLYKPFQPVVYRLRRLSTPCVMCCMSQFKAGWRWHNTWRHMHPLPSVDGHHSHINTTSCEWQRNREPVHVRVMPFDIKSKQQLQVYFQTRDLLNPPTLVLITTCRFHSHAFVASSPR